MAVVTRSEGKVSLCESANGANVTEDPSAAVDPRADDPYEGVDVSRLPQWWRDCLAEFESHDLFTYVPAHFEDGVIVRSLLEDLEARLGVEIKLLQVGGDEDADWRVEVDGARVGTIPRTRLRYGITLVNTDSEEFEAMVTDAVDTDE